MSDEGYEGTGKYNFYVQIFNSPEHYCITHLAVKYVFIVLLNQPQRQKWIDEKSKLSVYW